MNEQKTSIQWPVLFILAGVALLFEPAFEKYVFNKNSENEQTHRGIASVNDNQENRYDYEAIASKVEALKARSIDLSEKNKEIQQEIVEIRATIANYNRILGLKHALYAQVNEK